jgi:hypothetical protein
VAHCECERRGVRLERLYDDAARCIAAAATGQLRHELEGPLLGAEVGKGEAGVGVDHSCDLDAREVMPLRHHLRPDERGRRGRREALERLAQRTGRDAVSASRRIRSRPGTAAPARLEALRPGADPRQLDRAALGAGAGMRLE